MQEFDDYYNADNEDNTDNEDTDNEDKIYLGVNEDNFLNRGIIGGFRVRVGARDLDLEKMRVYKEGINTLPEGMTLDKKIYNRTCAAENSDSDSDEDREKV